MEGTVRDMTSHDGRAAGNSKFDEVKRSIAARLEQAADSLRRKAESGETPESLGNYGQQASVWLQQSAEYIRDFDVRKADVELRKAIQKHPGQSLAIAAAAGLLVGVWIRRR